MFHTQINVLKYVIHSIIFNYQFTMIQFIVLMCSTSSSFCNRYRVYEEQLIIKIKIYVNSFCLEFKQILSNNNYFRTKLF